MQIRPIKTKADYQPALAQIERLVDAAPGTPAGDRLEVLATLVHAFEEDRYDIPLPDPIDALLYLLESCGMSPQDLAPYPGNRKIVSEVLGRKRALSSEMIRRLHNRLGISAEVLIQPYSVTA